MALVFPFFIVERMGEVDRRAVVAYFLFLPWVPARCLMVLAAAVLFSVQPAQTACCCYCPEHKHIYHSKFVVEMCMSI